jgi:hypothetical protein
VQYFDNSDFYELRVKPLIELLLLLCMQVYIIRTWQTYTSQIKLHSIETHGRTAGMNNWLQRKLATDLISLIGWTK